MGVYGVCRSHESSWQMKSYSFRASLQRGAQLVNGICTEVEQGNTILPVCSSTVWWSIDVIPPFLLVSRSDVSLE